MHVCRRVLSTFLAFLILLGAAVAASADEPTVWMLAPFGGSEAWVPLGAGELTGIADVPGAPPLPRPSSPAFAGREPTSWDGAVLEVQGWPEGARVTIDGLEIVPIAGMRRALRIALPPGRHAAELAGPGIGAFRLTFDVLVIEHLDQASAARPATPGSSAKASASP